MRTRLLIPTLMLLPLVLTSCTPEPKPLVYGQDGCAHCIMLLADDRYGAELVTTTGKTYPFDAIECLVAFLDDGAVPADKIHSLWVVDFDNPGTLIQAEAATFVHSPALPSPMGGNLTAFADPTSVVLTTAADQGQRLDWAGVRSLVQETGHRGHEETKTVNHHH